MSNNKSTEKSKIKKFLYIFIPFVLIAGIVATVVGLVISRNSKTPMPNSADRNFKMLTEKFTDIEIKDEASALQATKAGALLMGLEDAADELSLLSVNELDGLFYYRFQQNYKGYPVFGKDFVLVSKGIEAADLTTNCFEIDKVDLEIQITAEDAKTAIKNKLTDITGVSDFEFFESEELLDDKLCIYVLEDNSARLAYQLYAITEFGYYKFFIDSITGEILFGDDATSKVQQSFTCSGQMEQHTFQAEAGEHYNEMYYISDTGTKITVYLPKDGTDEYGHKVKYLWHLQDDEYRSIVQWSDGEEPDPSAVDAMYNITKAYNYFKSTFGWDSFSNGSEDKDKEINVYIHAEGFYSGEEVEERSNNAAFWVPYSDPLIVVYNCYKSEDNHKEENRIDDFGIYLDVMGHEYTHGIVAYTSRLTNSVYNHMPAAINEAIADIMGNCIEADVKGKEIDWIIDMPGVSCRTSIKNDPHHKNYYPNHPDFQAAYHVDDYDEWVKDKHEEHYASTIISYAAYLMSAEGGGNLRDKEIARLWYSTLYTLPSDCTFHALASHVLLAASNLNFTESKIDTILEAFHAVGIDVGNSEQTYGPDIDLQVIDSAYQLYDDYTMEITGSRKAVWIFNNDRDYNETIEVKTSRPQHLKLEPGVEYTITVYDNKDKSKRYSKSFSVGNLTSFESEMYLFTNFGEKPAVDAGTDANIGKNIAENADITREEEFTKYLEDILIPEKGIADQTQSYVQRSEMEALAYTVYSYRYDSASDSIVRDRKKVSLQSGGLTMEQMREEAKVYEDLIDSYSYAGIISVDMHDYDCDGETEMLVLTGYDFTDEYGFKRHGCNAEFYDVNEKGNIELYEKFNVSMYEGVDEMIPAYEIGREDGEEDDYGFIVAQRNYVFDLDDVRETTLLSSNATMKRTLKFNSYAEDYSIMEWDSVNVGTEGILIDSGSKLSYEDMEEQAKNFESLLQEKGYINDTLVKLCDLKNGMIDYTGFSKKYCFGIDQ